MSRGENLDNLAGELVKGILEVMGDGAPQGDANVE